MWSDTRIREICLEGDHSYREALVREGLFTPPPEPVPEPVVSFSSTIPFPDWPRMKRQPTKMIEIAEEVAREHGLSVDDLKGPSRKQKIVDARHECFWRMRKELGKSFPQIGAFFHKDHTTVLHGVRKWEAEIA